MLLLKRKCVEKLYPEFALLNILFYWVSFKTYNLEVSEWKSPRKRYFRNRILKKIVDLGISTTKFPLVPSFISNKALWSFRTNLPKKVILATEFEKTISTPEYSFIPSVILNKVLWSFETKIAQKLWCSDGIYKNYSWKQLLIPLCTQFHFKQNTFKFGDQIFPKKVFEGRNLRDQLPSSESGPVNTTYRFPF